MRMRPNYSRLCDCQIALRSPAVTLGWTFSVGCIIVPECSIPLDEFSIGQRIRGVLSHKPPTQLQRARALARMSDGGMKSRVGNASDRPNARARRRHAVAFGGHPMLRLGTSSRFRAVRSCRSVRRDFSAGCHGSAGIGGNRTRAKRRAIR